MYVWGVYTDMCVCGVCVMVCVYKMCGVFLCVWSVICGYVGVCAYDVFCVSAMCMLVCVYSVYG